MACVWCNAQEESLGSTVFIFYVQGAEEYIMDSLQHMPLTSVVHYCNWCSYQFTIWKIKVSLCIKIFMWFVHKEVILTKDNLMKINWVGNPRCCFCDQNETIKHLFLECPLAKLLWRSIHIAFNIQPPMSINTLLGKWLNGVDICNTHDAAISPTSRSTT